MRNVVTVTPNDQGQVVTAYNDNPKYGFVKLTSEQKVLQGTWVKKKKRSTLLKGEVEDLKDMFIAGQQLEGKIQVIECTEDNIPAEQAKQLDKSKGFEEQIKFFLKRGGSEDAPVLMAGDKRILRFTQYDESGTAVDIRVAHTNTDEIKAYNAAKVSGDAQLPG